MAACGLFAADDLHAQEVAPPTPPPASSSGDGGPIAYPPAFFAEFKPVSAYDMVLRLPGFSFSGGADVRGFGGAAGNVLIDGERPSSKSVSLGQVLGRIPVSQVERIDLVRGGAPGIDMQGQPVVANIIRKKGSTSSAAITTLVKPFADGFVGVIPRIDASWRSGPLTLEGLISKRVDRTPNSGEGPVWRRSAAGATVQSGRFTVDDRQNNLDFNAAAEYRPGVDVLRLNLAAVRDQSVRRERSDLRDALGPYLSLNDSREVEKEWEIGGDYQRPITATTSAQLIALANGSKSHSIGANRGRGALQESAETSEDGERIVRGVLSAAPSDALRLESGAESALNFLDTHSSLSVGGVAEALPSDTVRVEERRAEAFASANWTVSPSISLEGGMRYERSTISQTGGASQEKTLSFAKPRLIVSWAPDKASQLRLRVERTVGQLRFNDFAASAELDTGAHNAGNRDLEPERAWVVETALERRFWSTGAVVLTLTHEAVESIVDVIPIDGRFDAPGNIGDGWREAAQLNITLPFDRLGMTGALLKLNTTWKRSEVTDPVTGATRRVSDENPFGGDFLFTQSFKSLNSILGLEGRLGSTRTTYRISEVRKTTETPSANLWWDWTPRAGTVIRFQAENITAKTTVRKRALYGGPRSTGAIATYERREAQFDPFVMVRVRQAF
jgi:TonB dependent receptor